MQRQFDELATLAESLGSARLKRRAVELTQWLNRPTTHVVVCGEFNRGKSTLVNALFRLADTASGSVHIDGVDIATLQPHYLRSKLAAVPQDTLVIAGTLRYKIQFF